MIDFLHSLRSGLLACAIFFALPLISLAQDWEHVTKLMAKYPNGNSAASSSMSYGYAISISGNFAVIGANSDYYDASGLNSMQWAGSAFILYNDGGVWKPVKKLVAPVRSQSAQFGTSVSIDGDYIVIGEPGERLDGSAKGSVYIFKKDQGGAGNWGLLKRIQANVRNTGDNFGWAVDISGDHIVVSSHWYDLDANDQNALSDAGAAFIYEKNLGGADNWGLVKKITASVRRADHNFGTSIAIDADQIVVGAGGERRDAAELNPLGYAGAAYVFRKDYGGSNNWGQVKKLTAPVRAADDNFGNQVDISGNNIIAGAPFEDEDANELNTLGYAGSAYIFSRDSGGNENWGLAKKITASQRQFEAYFGQRVAISGNFAAVGSRRDERDANGANQTYEAGAVFLFEENNGGTGNWAQLAKFVPPVRVSQDQFGTAVAINGRYLFGTSMGRYLEPADNTSATNPGAVYVFRQDDPLPVTLANFNVSRVENQAFLQWTTSAETNTSHFEIQKSLNAKDWTAIGTCEAAKESKALIDYTHWDNQLTAGNIYYRLKMVDQDGTFAYSSIRNLLGENGAELVAFPNPATDRIFIKATDSNQIESVEIRNTTGLLVFETAKMDGEGIATDKFAPGNYIVQIRNTNGTLVTRKITISR
ncbi:Por secretion system C-terminal sorting domain-containing protein [Dyadobacter sp. SG02]|uniref:T9SS type A sorting domain-containing protein n=1 Tax=Dyadobacter sp. SG02 TaxID=1855291 RepID=UPI0008B6CEA2|nr:T9SS type A sorting domain-containing protein [Dyadobacter sp. SG02]SEI59230.1 Por secretion system C-terminal sorting domain-containing protein [Dyadobacter sp. SG02]